MADITTVDEYIRSFPDDVQEMLEEVRRTIHRAVPHGGEKISYRMPAVTLDGRYVVYFAAWKGHLSVYPVPTGDDAFDREIAPYKSGKGTARFPLGEPIPYGLIERLAGLLAQQRMKRAR